jgi:hypothetical protein
MPQQRSQLGTDIVDVQARDSPDIRVGVEVRWETVIVVEHLTRGEKVDEGRGAIALCHGWYVSDLVE